MWGNRAGPRKVKALPKVVPILDLLFQELLATHRQYTTRCIRYSLFFLYRYFIAEELAASLRGSISSDLH
jgi:hypothetical protein